MTRARKAVLELVSASEEPRTALHFSELLKHECDQATVYRALHYLESANHLESFVLSCKAHGVERYYVGRDKAHRHWFHCESCHRFIDLGACTLGKLIQGIEAERGIQVMSHTFYISGICKECLGAV